MARPKLDITRHRQLNIGLTDTEYDTVLRLAAGHRMRPVDYARSRLFGRSVAVVSSAASGGGHLDPLFFNELSRIGSNINQIARQLNALQWPLPHDLEPLLAELRAILRNRAQR